MTDPYADLADQLADVGRAAVGRGLVVASGGNLSARCPDRDAFLVTGAGTWLDRLTRDDLALVGLDGSPLEGPEPSSEWRLHRATYRVRPDVHAVVHLHPQTAVVLDALGYPVRLLTLDHATYLRRIERIPYFPNGSDELADASAEASRDVRRDRPRQPRLLDPRPHRGDGLAARAQPRGGRVEHVPLPPARRYRHDVPRRPAGHASATADRRRGDRPYFRSAAVRTTAGCHPDDRRPNVARQPHPQHETIAP